MRIRLHFRRPKQALGLGDGLGELEWLAPNRPQAARWARRAGIRRPGLARRRPCAFAPARKSPMQALVLGDLGTARSRCGDAEGASSLFYANALEYTKRSTWKARSFDRGESRGGRVRGRRRGRRPPTRRAGSRGPRGDAQPPLRPRTTFQYGRLPDRSRLFRRCPRLRKRSAGRRP